MTVWVICMSFFSVFGLLCLVDVFWKRLTDPFKKGDTAALVKAGDVREAVRVVKDNANHGGRIIVLVSDKSDEETRKICDALRTEGITVNLCDK